MELMKNSKFLNNNPSADGLTILPIADWSGAEIPSLRDCRLLRIH